MVRVCHPNTPMASVEADQRATDADDRRPDYSWASTCGVARQIPKTTQEVSPSRLRRRWSNGLFNKASGCHGLRF